MLTLNIKIVELLTDEKHTSMNPLNIFVVCSGAINTKINKLKIIKNKNDDTLHCQKSLVYELQTANKNSLLLELKRHRVIVADDLLGRLTLPLSWFPTNHVVREWFPFKAASKKVKNAMALLDVHIDARKVTPFMAPFATLRVFPCWNRPNQTVNADFVVPPPMVYILSSGERRTIPLQQLRQMASSQQVNQSTSQVLPNAQPIAQNYTPIVANQSQLNSNTDIQQQQQQQLQRSQSLVQRPSHNISNQRPQSQFIPQHQIPQSQNQTQQQQAQPPRPAPFPSYPPHSSDDELEKDEEVQRQQNQQNCNPYFPPSQPPSQDLYSPPTSPNNQYIAPTYQPPQGNTSTDTPYTPSIY